MAETQTATPATTAAPVAGAAVNKTEKVGQVVSTKMAKTIVVQVTRRVQHKLYKRIIKKNNKFYAHDEQQSAKVGDTVRIIESRPLSKLKRWTLTDVIRRAVQVGEIEPAEKPTGNTLSVKKKKK
jgi:small subunit ribosomal protein S17